jgi:hypothetical protein
VQPTDSPSTSCPACEEGGCLEHQAEAPAPAPAPGSDFVTRAELEKTRKDVARSTKRLNRAIKAAREQAPPPEPLPADPLPAPAPPRKHSDVTKLGLRFLDSCRRKGK